MRILIIANNKIEEGRFPYFVIEQMKALMSEGVIIDSYGISGKGVFGYLKCVKGIINKIREFNPDLIHAHYGLSGLCANLQRQVPVVTTYHGSDIHSGGWILKLSQLAMRLSAYNIFVTHSLLSIGNYKSNNACVQSCGLDLNTIKEMDRTDARRVLGWNNFDIKILFSASFTNKNKNADLAKASVEKVEGAELIELNGYTRQEVNLLMNACNLQLTTSNKESGPLVVKEAMACGTPVVSVCVGDVKEIIGNTEGCYIAKRNPDDIADKIKKALNFNGKTNGRQRIIDLGLDNRIIAKRIVSIYEEILKRKK